jgi:hypothetical protein
MQYIQICIKSGIIYHFYIMRTTLTLSAEAYEIVQRYAESCDVSLSKAVSELVERAARKRMRIRYEHGIPVFDEPEDGPKITTEMVKRLEAEDY